MEKREFEKRVYLAVPFKEKNEAKELGAWWDPKAKKWYVPAKLDPAKFVKWNQPEQMNLVGDSIESK